MLTIGAKDVERLHKFLKDLSPQALPHAARESMNAAAFATRHEWAAEGKRTMTVRNHYTFGGRHHRVVKARTARVIESMQSVVGNNHKYMREQENGVVRRGGWFKSVPIPTTVSRRSNDRTKTQRPTFWRRKILLGARKSRDQFQSRGQYIAATKAAAKRRGLKFVYLDLGSWGRGIFDIRLKRKMKKVWNLNRKSTRTRANPMLRRSLQTLRPEFERHHKSALENQIRFVLKKRGLRVSSASSVIKRVIEGAPAML